jgi:cell division protein FtsB
LAVRSVFIIMRTLTEIKQQIDRLSDQRAEVLKKLSQGHNAELAAEHKKLDAEIAELWDEQRAVRATIRFGDRELIIQRARHEERLSRAA